MDILVRIAYVDVALTLAFRALGKPELSQVSPFELVTPSPLPRCFSEAQRCSAWR